MEVDHLNIKQIFVMQYTERLDLAEAKYVSFHHHNNGQSQPNILLFC